MLIEKEVEFRTRMGRIITAHAGREAGRHGYSCTLGSLREPTGLVEPPDDFPRSAMGAHVGDAILMYQTALDEALAQFWPHDGVTDVALVNVERPTPGPGQIAAR